jgi:hypothetical protein
MGRSLKENSKVGTQRYFYLKRAKIKDLIRIRKLAKSLDSSPDQHK